MSVADRSRIIQALWRSLGRLGLPAERVLAHAGLPAGTTTETFLTTAQVFAVWRAVESLSGDAAIAIRVVEELGNDSTAHPLAVVAALHARDVGAGFDVLMRYKQLTSTEQPRLEVAGRETFVWTEWIHATEPVPAVAVDQGLALLVLLARQGTRTRVTPVRVELRRSGVPNERLRAFFGCPIAHAADTNRIVLATAELARPFTAYNAELLRVLEPSLTASLADHAANSSLRVQVKRALKRHLADGRPELEHVAAELHLSERTLQRRITEEGTTFRELLAEARRELGRELLVGDSKVAEVAFLLGYRDTSSFQRAFREWEGLSPSEWRELNRRMA